MSSSESRPIITRLALSGGGFRATLFHLGVIEHLRDAGVLSGVEEISSVSGGSICAAHLVLNWDRYNGTAEDFASARNELVNFTSLDIRGRIVRRLMLPWWLFWRRRILALFLGASQAAPTWMLRTYYRKLFGNVTLHELPDTPRLHLLATNLTKGCLTSFGQKQVVHFPSSPAEPVVEIDAALTPLASAVAASSAYPALFPPLSFTGEDVGAKRSHRFGKEFFTDAGVSDNLGLRPFEYPGPGEGALLISDAGQSFMLRDAFAFGLVRTALRAADLMMFRIRELALAGSKEAHAGKTFVASISDCEELPGAAPKSIQQCLEGIRTDLDAFSAIEAEELMRHGYFRSQRVLGIEGSNPPVFRFSKQTAAARSRHLIGGARRKMRLVNRADWITWVHCALVLALIGLAWIAAPKVRDKFVTYANLTRWEAINRPAPEWQVPDQTLQPTVVDTLEDPTNEGFSLTQDDRVWDLRRLVRDTHTGEVHGKSLLTRQTTMTRQEGNATAYQYHFETSGSDLIAWCLNSDLLVSLRTTPEAREINGGKLLKPWNLGVDVSRKPLNQPFILGIQAQSVDGFKSKENWWVGVKFATHLNTASVRIIFPLTLRYQNPKFLTYPNDTSSEAPSSEGFSMSMTGKDSEELLWIIPSPRENWTYRVQWDW